MGEEGGDSVGGRPKSGKKGAVGWEAGCDGGEGGEGPKGKRAGMEGFPPFMKRLNHPKRSMCAS